MSGAVKIPISSDKDMWQWWYLGVLGVLECRTSVVSSLIMGTHYSCATSIVLSDSLRSLYVGGGVSAVAT